MDTLIQYVERILSWLLQFVDWILIETFSVVCAACAAVLAAIPMPSWVSQAGTSLQNLPSGVLYFAQCWDLNTGIPVILTACGIRFLIRRLPIIG